MLAAPLGSWGMQGAVLGTRRAAPAGQGGRPRGAPAPLRRSPPRSSHLVAPPPPAPHPPPAPPQIMEHLIQRWRIADLQGLNPKAAEAQEFVCNLPARIRRLAERKAVRKAKTKKELVRPSSLFAFQSLVSSCLCQRAAQSCRAAARCRWRVGQESGGSQLGSGAVPCQPSCPHPPPSATHPQVKFSWLHDRPLELHRSEMTTARTRGTGAATA